MSRYIRFHVDIGYYTGGDYYYAEYSEDTPDVVIENDGNDLFYQHCDDYAYLITAGFDESLESEWDKEWENAIEQCSWSWVEVAPEEYFNNI